MFNNARTYNQEGSWVYIDADEMEKVFNATWDKVIAGSDLPGAPPLAGAPAPPQARMLRLSHHWMKMNALVEVQGTGA